MGRIVDRRIAGVFFVLVPVLFWIYIYIWYDCQGGRCSLPMDWLMVGFFAILFGVFLLISQTEEPKIIVEKKEKKKKNAKQKKTV